MAWTITPSSGQNELVQPTVTGQKNEHSEKRNPWDLASTILLKKCHCLVIVDVFSFFSVDKVFLTAFKHNND